MIRVLWSVPNTPSWIGGLNYFINLYEGLQSLSDRQIEPILIKTDRIFPPPLSNCPTIPWGNQIQKKKGRCLSISVIKKLYKLLFPPKAIITDETFIRFLQDHNIKLLSHGNALGKKSPIPSLCWIADFQHRHLPQFFSHEEIIIRNRAHQQIAEEAQGIIFSSENARDDFNRFHPGFENKTYILHFVATVHKHDETFTANVLKKYAINTPFFHIPNQIWAHKNHIIVIKALTILKKKGCSPLIISTGQTEDYRDPGYFYKLKQFIDSEGLSTNIRFLGLIEYDDMQAIMQESMCLINPSLFEGWSTTVEEAKSLGKRILLSDIPVHHEQAPERGSYFDPNDPEELASKIDEVIHKYNRNEEKEAMEKAITELPNRVQVFGQQYQNIVLKVISDYKDV